MSNIKSHPSNRDLVNAFIMDSLASAFMVAAHIPFKGCVRDLKARTETRSAALAEFWSLSDETLADVATIQWRREEDHLVETAVNALTSRLGWPAIEVFLRVSAHWRGNPVIGPFYERTARLARPITVQENREVDDHAGTV